jgi:hypothetical protein
MHTARQDEGGEAGEDAGSIRPGVGQGGFPRVRVRYHGGILTWALSKQTSIPPHSPATWARTP